MARTGRYRKMLLLGGLFGFVGPLMMCFWHRGTSEVFYWATMPFGGAAYGSILTITLVALIASVDPKDMAAATGVTYLFRATGSVLGISLSSAILQNSLQKNLEKTDIPRKVIQLIRQDAGAIKELSKPLRQAAIGAYEQSMHTVFIAIAAAGFLAFLALFFIEERDLPGKKPAAPAAAPARAQR